MSQLQQTRAGRRRAGAYGRLSSDHRCAQAQRHQDALRRARHSHHRLPAACLRPKASAYCHSAMSKMRATPLDRGLPDQTARRLHYGFGAGLPQRPDRARACHDQLLPDDPDLRLIRARDRRFAAGRLRGDGPARRRQAAVQGRLPHPACAGHRHRHRSRDPRRGVGASGRRLPRSAGQAVRPGDERRSRQEVAGEGDRCGAGANSRPRLR